MTDTQPPLPPRSDPRRRTAALIARLCPGEGFAMTALDGVMTMRANGSLERMPTLYEPSVCIVAQGRKRGFHGGRTYVYDAQHFLALAVPLPFESETEATPEEPLLGLALRVEPQLTAELALALDEARGPAPQPPLTMMATPMDEGLSDATLRLCEALSSPLEARLLAPAIYREILYRVLTSEQGGALRAALTQGGQFGRIARSLRRIHAHYDSELDVASLAGEANMSVPAFHSHFKAVTHTSPIQYLKSIRLHQARLLMIRNGHTAASAAIRVGYASASQFSREFKRLFGNSPAEEARRLQQVLSLSQPLSFAQD
ncbi:AraC family transcriptional regulator [Chitinimonas koreensis]|uniref:AraC family transcriptional regulator n=1 Tax=Chitinimonas koreensis TaxID=356302 RepID=UPI00048C8BD8|nr:AraC family transcriptional regulator [Chitinimonas koreensis]QNM96773.1 AraC family transcriptional regulator [Chitinimonas koreensis]